MSDLIQAFFTLAGLALFATCVWMIGNSSRLKRRIRGR